MSATSSSHSVSDQSLNLIKEVYGAERTEIDPTIEYATHGETSLHIAVNNGNIDMIEILIEAGLDVNIKDNLGKTPIMYAIENKPEGYLQMIEMFIKAHANICTSDEYGISLAQLVFTDVNYFNDHISKLFLNVIHQKCMNNAGITAKILMTLHCPLWQAVLLENSEVIERMILDGCPINSCHPVTKLTALSKAVQLMNLDMVKVLTKYGADVNLCDNKGYLPITHYGSWIPGSIHNPEIIKILLNKTDSLKNVQGAIVHQLQKVFRSGNKEIIQILLEHQDDILNIRDHQGQTPLHYLSCNYHSDITEVLRGRKIDVNISDFGGRTPLHTATQHSYSHINTFKFLCENGADVNATSVFQGADVALFSLCENPSFTKEAYFEIIELFIENGLDIQFVGLNQITVFDIIMEKCPFYMAEPLLAHLAKLAELGTPILECIRNKINSNRMLKEYFDSCKDELEQMKNDIINTNLTLYMIVVDQISDRVILKRCRFSANSLSTFEKLITKLDPRNHYYSTIQKSIYPIVSKLKLLRKAAPVVCKITRLISDPYHIAIIEILDYLDNRDLQNLIETKL